MRRYGSVYVVTNQRTGDQYVGQTRRDVAKRWAAHWSVAKSTVAQKYRFQNALMAYGPEAFLIEEVFHAFDADGLNQAEINLIAELKPAYNLTSGGQGERVAKESEAVRAAKSNAAKKRWLDSAWREKMVDKLWHDPDVKSRRIAKLKEISATHEVRSRLSSISKNRTTTRESAEKIARSKWKPLYCPELQTTFLCGKYAAEQLGVLPSSICNAMKRQGKLSNGYSLFKVA